MAWREKIIKAIERNLIKEFNRFIKELKIDIRHDNEWPFVANKLVNELGQNAIEEFWQKILKYFKKQEKVLSHCHKGLIYWRLAEFRLKKGEYFECLRTLEKAKKEDEFELPDQITASKVLLAILKPLFYRYKDKKGRTIDSEIQSEYESLNTHEKSHFADLIFNAYNNAALNGTIVIKSDFFGFISSKKKRKILVTTYDEARRFLLMINSETYYSIVFSIGSIIEAMLDDLFTRKIKNQKEKIWEVFKNTKDSTINIDSLLNKDVYPDGLNLGQKIFVLRFLAKKDICPIPKEVLFLMVIILEYRNLIHPRRRHDLEFEPNQKVVLTLFTFISQVASYWWQRKIRYRLDKKL